MKTFEGEVKNLIKNCVEISHFHRGIDYQDAFELTYFEKQIISKFIADQLEREGDTQLAMLKAMGYRSK